MHQAFDTDGIKRLKPSLVSSREENAGISCHWEEELVGVTDGNRKPLKSTQSEQALSHRCAPFSGALYWQGLIVFCCSVVKSCLTLVTAWTAACQAPLLHCLPGFAQIHVQNNKDVSPFIFIIVLEGLAGAIHKEKKK